MPREFCRSCYQRLGGGAVICESCAAGGAKQPAYLAELRGKGRFFFFFCNIGGPGRAGPAFPRTLATGGRVPSRWRTA